MSTRRAAKGGWVDGTRNVPRGPNGRALCRWCCQEVPKQRRTFCSQACVDEHLARTNPHYARSLVWRRDNGVCALCGLDTEYLRETAEWLSRLAVRRWRFGRDCTGRWPRLDDDGRDGAGDERAAAALVSLTRAYLGRTYRSQQSRWSAGALLVNHLWEADHIVPVVEGGGECGLDGFRTLCLPCHHRVTRELRARMAGQHPRDPNLQQPALFGSAA